MIPFFLVFFFPYANTNKWKRFPVATYSLILLNVIAFAFEPGGYYGETRFDALNNLIYLPGRSPWYTVLSNNFLHANLAHLFFNLWFLHLIGGQVEERMGSLLFLIFYLAGGVCSSLMHGLYCRLIGMPVGLLGASGSIYAVLGAYFVLYPFEEFRFWYFAFYRFGTIKIATFFFVLYNVAVTSLWAWITLSMKGGATVAHWAHLGGLVFGLAVGFAAFGIGAFTGETRPGEAEERRLRSLRRIARRKLYSDAPGKMTPEEIAVATEDLTPLEAIRRGLFFHNGRLIEWGYQEMLLDNPKTCLEPDMQLAVIRELRIHGRESLAQLASLNLLDSHPYSHEAQRVRLDLARMFARLPEQRTQAVRLLREFLDGQVEARERFEAEKLLRYLEAPSLDQWKTKSEKPPE